LNDIVRSTFSAFWLLVLILLPFRAPFSAGDIVDFFDRSATDQEVAPAPPTSSTALIADAGSSLLVPPLAGMARQLGQIFSSDASIPPFARGVASRHPHTAQSIHTTPQVQSDVRRRPFDADPRLAAARTAITSLQLFRDQPAPPCIYPPPAGRFKKFLGRRGFCV
jgi:hypothetical protein